MHWTTGPKHRHSKKADIIVQPFLRVPWPFLAYLFSRLICHCGLYRRKFSSYVPPENVGETYFLAKNSKWTPKVDLRYRYYHNCKTKIIVWLPIFVLIFSILVRCFVHCLKLFRMCTEKLKLPHKRSTHIVRIILDTAYRWWWILILGNQTSPL